MKRLQDKSGFTLLELILALAIVGFIVALSMGGIKLSISAREAGDTKVDTFQRLRVINEQLSQKIKSNYPAFISQDTAEAGATPQPKPLVLAFEGKEDSIRFITFSPPLTAESIYPWAHEVKFYLGEHPKTKERGLLMMERDISHQDLFTEIPSNSRDVRYLLLAQNVDHLKFRYYMMRKLNPEEQKAAGTEDVTYEGKWVDTIQVDPLETSGKLVQEQNASLLFEKANKMTLPRAVEISLGLTETPHPDGKEGRKEPKIIFSPPITVLIHSGMKFALPTEDEKNNAT